MTDGDDLEASRRAPALEQLDLYQRLAIQTDVLPRTSSTRFEDDLVMPMLGLAGEVGALAAELKKRQRDHLGFEGFRQDVREELGDMLWYIAVMADRADIDLSDLALANLLKVADTFGGQPSLPHVAYDHDRPEGQRLPRQLRVQFRESTVQREGHDLEIVTVHLLDDGGKALGDPIDDNNEHQDDYRFHDVFHLAHMAVLGWSPVVRNLFGPKRKRRGDPTEWIQDGGRAMVVEEGLTAAVFAEASRHHFFNGATRVPSDLLKLCKRMTSHLEVNDRTHGDWQRAILAGYEVFGELRQHRVGEVRVDQDSRTLQFMPT